jgi:hypothetical protein
VRRANFSGEISLRPNAGLAEQNTKETSVAVADNDLDRAGKQRFVQAFATAMRTGGAGRKRGYVIAVVAAVVISAGAAVAIGAIGKPGKGSDPASLSALSRNSSRSPSPSGSTTPSVRPGAPGNRKSTPRSGAQPTYVVVQGGGSPPRGASPRATSPRRTTPAPSSSWSTGVSDPTTQGAEQPAEPSSTPPAPAPSTAAPTPAPTPGSLFITGQVECESGASVEGVWVGTANGPGWASWMKIGNGSTSDWWFTLPANEPYHLNVGCGGSPSAWTLTITTPTVTGGHNSFNCYDGPSEADYKTCVLR